MKCFSDYVEHRNGYVERRVLGDSLLPILHILDDLITLPHHTVHLSYLSVVLVLRLVRHLVDLSVCLFHRYHDVLLNHLHFPDFLDVSEL